jgi:T5SS/PEP-CTERM-associated repeat protein/autotransporter-associated beta strand protein
MDLKILPAIQKRSTILLYLLSALMMLIGPFCIIGTSSGIDLFVGSNSSSQTTNFITGTNSYSNSYIGYNSGDSNNLLSVRGAGTVLVNTKDLNVGYDGSHNSLMISNGATVENGSGSYGGVIGLNSDSSNNSVLVTGANSLWNNSADLIVGYDGYSNSLTISNGATVENGSSSYGGVIGLNSDSSNNSVLVMGTNSLWNNSGDLIVGYDGYSNSLTISNGATVLNEEYYYGGVIGYNSDSSNNSVLVTGSNSLWNNSGDLIIGYDGYSNSLTISNGATVENGSSSYGGVIGLNSDSSNNSVLVTGSNSLWNNSGDLIVGLDGSGNSLVISNGGAVTNSQYNYGGVLGLNADSSNNSVLVTGTNSLWNNSGDLIVGYDGYSNSLTISNGATVLNEEYYYGGVIGYNSDSSNNSVLVTGSNSLWNNSGDLIIGYDGYSNSLTISKGATVENGSSSYGGVIGLNSDSSNNSVLVTGSNSLWNNSGDLIVGLDGSGNSLVISNGGVVTNSQYNYGGVLGLNADSSNNSVLVTGSNSLWNNSGDLIIGYDGYSNSLTISKGATVENGSSSYGGVIGLNSDSSNNSVLVTGTNSLWNNSGDLIVGLDGSGNSLVISNGGKVSNAYSQFGAVIGLNTDSSNNSVMVSGPQSLMNNALGIINGSGGSGNILVISNSGVVASGYGVISSTSLSSNNSVLVSGSGSLWTNINTLTVGAEGNGTLTLANGGTVVAAFLTIASQSGSSGTLNIGRLGTNDSAASLTTPTINFGAGTGTLNFNQSGTATISSTISSGIVESTRVVPEMTTNGTVYKMIVETQLADGGTDSVNQLGSGTTILNGNNSYSGTTTINAGTLQTASTDALGTSTVSLNGGTLALSTNLTISSLIWNSAGVIALPNLGNGAFLNLTGALTLTGSRTNTFNLTGDSLGSTPTEFLAWENGSVTTSNFTIVGVGRYTLSITNNSLWISVLPDSLYVGSNNASQTTNFTSGNNIYSNTYVGLTTNASNNLLIVGGDGTILSNATNLIVGYAGSGNSLVISNGGTVSDLNGTIGYTNTSSNNSVLVTGSNSLWSNRGTLTVGDAGGGSLTAASGGKVIASGGITVAAQSGSSGTIVIGSLPSSSGSGTFTTPSITFGLGTSMISTMGTLPGGSNSILPGTPLIVDDPLQIALTNSTLNISIPLGGSTNVGNMTYTFNRSGSTFYADSTTNGPPLQPVKGFKGTWNNLDTSSNWQSNNTAAGPFTSSNNALFTNASSITVATIGVTANLISENAAKGTMSFKGGTINATAFSKSGAGKLTVADRLALIGSCSVTGSGAVTLSGNLMSGALFQSGLGTLTLVASNSYSGGTVLNSGTVVIGNNSSLGSGPLYFEGSSTITDIASLTVQNPTSLLGGSSATFNVKSRMSVVGAVNGTGSLVKAGVGSLTLGGTNSYSGGTTVTKGVLIGTTTSLQGQLINNATVVFNQTGSGTFTGNISGTGKLAVIGSGSVTLTGSNSYDGGTMVTLGSLAASSLGSGGLTLKAAKGAMASFTDTLNSGSLDLEALTLNGNSTIYLENPYSSITSTNGAITISGTNNFIDLSGAWTNLGTYPLLTGTKITGGGFKKLDLTGLFIGQGMIGLDQSINYNGLNYTFTNSSNAFDLMISATAPAIAVNAESIIFPDDNPSAGALSLEAVPEPSASSLFGLGALLLAITRLLRPFVVIRQVKFNDVAGSTEKTNTSKFRLAITFAKLEASKMQTIRICARFRHLIHTAWDTMG